MVDTKKLSTSTSTSTSTSGVEENFDFYSSCTDLHDPYSIEMLDLTIKCNKIASENQTYPNYFSF